jgi:Mg-chelatase subunit ChlI
MAQEAMRARIRRARVLLPRVSISDETHAFICQICLLNEVDGHRADIYIGKAAKTIAAFNLRLSPTLEDMSQAAKLVLPHRSRKVDLPKKTLEDFHRMLEEEIAKNKPQKRQRRPRGDGCRSGRLSKFPLMVADG